MFPSISSNTIAQPATARNKIIAANARNRIDAPATVSHSRHMEKLKAYLDEAKRAGTSAAAFSELIGKSPAAVSRYASGKQRPTLETMAMIEKVTHKAVPISAWLRTPDRL